MNDARLLTQRGGRDIQDETVIRNILAGDRESFRLLSDKYRSYLYQVIYAVLGHPKDAEDITQDVLVKLYVSLPQYQFQGFKTWMTRIAVNKAIDYKRSRQRKKEDVTETPEQALPIGADTAQGAESTVEAALLRKSRREAIRRKIADLPPNYRDVVQAYFIEDKTYQEIAAEQGVAVKTVESKLYRAKQWIRSRWKEEDFE